MNKLTIYKYLSIVILSLFICANLFLVIFTETFLVPDENYWNIMLTLLPQYNGVFVYNVFHTSLVPVFTAIAIAIVLVYCKKHVDSIKEYNVWLGICLLGTYVTFGVIYDSTIVPITMAKDNCSENRALTIECIDTIVKVWDTSRGVRSVELEFFYNQKKHKIIFNNFTRNIIINDQAPAKVFIKRGNSKLPYIHNIIIHFNSSTWELNKDGHYSSALVE